MNMGANTIQTPAPQLNTMDLKDKVGRGLKITCIARPATVLAEIHNFLHEGTVPADIRTPMDNKPWTVQAAAFIDNVQVDLEVQVYGNDQESTTSTIVFNQDCHNDIVRFHRLIARFQQHALSRGIITSDQCVSSSLPMNSVLEDFDDFEFETDSQERVEALFAQLEDGRAATRLEAVQLLASWAETEPDYRFCLAEAFRMRPVLLHRFVQTLTVDPLCESYPKTAAIRFIVGCPKAAQVLHEPLLPLLTDLAVQHLPKLIQMQIALTLEALRKFGFERMVSLSAASTTWKCASSVDNVTNSFVDSSKFGSMALGGQLSEFLFEDNSPKNTHSSNDILFVNIPPKVAKLHAIASTLWE
jgi:hypothetical protein